MLAPHIRKTVDKLWDRFWSAGLTNPLVAVEQITYLLFLKRLEDLDNQRTSAGKTSKTGKQGKAGKRDKATKPSVYDKRVPGDQPGFDGQTCRWSHIRAQESNKPQHLIEVVFPWLRTLDQRLTADEEGTELAGLNGRMADAYFQLDPNKGQVLHDAIHLIDELFAQAGDGSAAQDLMGDTFEYLLSEVATAGKNGQFRTPRHIIRFMVELLAPRPGEHIIDPAAGTGGFLFSAQQFMRRQLVNPEDLRLEWDGAPHRLEFTGVSKQTNDLLRNGRFVVGIDNDRTMARIGWMNLVLHDIDNPRLLQGDSLSSRKGKPTLASLLASETYRHVLANPPFTGTVDTEDLEHDSLLFPPAGAKGKKKNEVLTNKSELLFLWLMLDLLEVGGRCAVIIPEGVLFGNTEAHVKLRRELLTEHCVEGVISLFGGVFQPYTGVKTSILVFRKETPRERKTAFEQAAPRTQTVWFYEVLDDGFTHDAKRAPKPGQDNDLWDALVQFQGWQQQGLAALEGAPQQYYQPRYYRERWRMTALRDADGRLTPAGFAFADDTKAAPCFDGKTWAMHEIFGGLPVDPGAAEDFIRERVSPQLAKVARRHFAHGGKTASTDWNRAREAFKSHFENDGPAVKLWRELTRAAQEQVGDAPKGNQLLDLNAALRPLAQEVAKVDGYDVDLRTLAIDQIRPASVRKCWAVPLRAWAVDTEWRSANGKLRGSHDAQGAVRSEYVTEKLPELYAEGTLNPNLLTPDCIEAREWNLSAGQYKPFDFAESASDVTVTELIDELRGIERGILEGLDRLQAMMEDRK